MNEEKILRRELLWSATAAGAVVLIVAVIVISSATMVLHPPSNVEPIDPTRLHASGEFVESNLGAVENPDRSVTVRIIATQFAFVPPCVVVPSGRPVTFRVTTPDVIHGMIVYGTNVNTMVIPGYVSQLKTRFPKSGDRFMPCHEYCGLGHGSMWSVIRVVPEGEWKPDANGRMSCATPR
jgi:cytochrome c oxidase subunit 2